MPTEKPETCHPISFQDFKSNFDCYPSDCFQGIAQNERLQVRVQNCFFSVKK